jgi:dihydrofolate reductase
MTCRLVVAGRTMRTVTYGAACSLDGFITGPGDALDWMHFSRDVMDVMADYMKGVDAMLMGRKTWQVAQALAADGARPPDSSSTKMQTYVFSRTLESLPDPNATLVRNDAAGFVRKLKKQSGSGICLMGGGELARSLFRADLIDEVGLNIHPVLLGGGVPMFPSPGPHVRLKLLNSRVISGGCVLVNFRVAHRRSRRAKTEG